MSLQNATLIRSQTVAEYLQVQAPTGYWQRGWKCYGHPGDLFVVRLYWPVSDPRPARRWW